jgi:hypothetical protein
MNANFTCQDCGFHVAVRSKKRGPWERFVVPLFLLRPARCANCFRRVYSWVWVPLREPVELNGPGSGVRPPDPSPTSHRVA